jgi:hypothetical protein
VATKFGCKLLSGKQSALPLLASLILLGAWSTPSHALPAFARQTGQNCVACHAGGQFPELTPYGRVFKLTGYTIGSRTIPFSVMGVVDVTKVRNPNDSLGVKDTDTFPKQKNALFDFGSVFLAGKITDNLGLFAQATYANYDHQDDQGNWKGHMTADNTEIRYADRFISPSSDLIVGAFANNNPSMQDVWNSTPAWGYPYVGPERTLAPPAAPQIASLGQDSVGGGVYAFWNQSLYAELSLYKSANGFFSFLHSGPKSETTKYNGANPYVRIAYSKEIGPHNFMIGASGMQVKKYVDNDTTMPTDEYQDYGVDGQYQYILDPHTVTAQISYIHEKAKWGDPSAYSNPSDTLKEFKIKGTYVYQAKYGASLTFDQITGSSDQVLFNDPSLGLSEVASNPNASPNATVWTPEVFWTPVQYLRIGAQYWHYTKFNGSGSDYNGFGRNASANDTLFVYAWGAY